MGDKELALLDQPDQFMDVIKQRNGDFEGKIALWFREEGLQFCESEKLTYPDTSSPIHKIMDQSLAENAQEGTFKAI